jgi:hypothetical protein
MNDIETPQSIIIDDVNNNDTDNDIDDEEDTEGAEGATGTDNKQVEIDDTDDITSNTFSEQLTEVPDSTKEASFTAGVGANGSFSVGDDDDIPDDDIKRMLFLFCVNEDIPLHYKQLLGKVIKKDSFKKNEKLFIFNMIGYVWKLAKEEKDLTKTQKVIIVRRIHKFIFGKFVD